MVDQNTFTETIRAVQDIIRTSAEPMTREEILSYFKDMDLNRQQEDMVFEFLTVPHEEEPVEEPAEDNGDHSNPSAGRLQLRQCSGHQWPGVCGSREEHRGCGNL